MILDPDLSSIRPLSSRPFTNVWASEDEERYTSSMVDNFTFNSMDGLPGRQIVRTVVRRDRAVMELHIL